LLAGAVMIAASAQNPPASPAPQTPAPAKPAANAPSKTANKKAAPAAPTTGPNGEIYIHAFHNDKLGGLDCSLCHTAVSDGSVEMKRPGHDQCGTCHSDDFANNYASARQTICSQCHTASTPRAASKNDLIPFPRYRGTRTILFQFSHAKHVDKQGRKDPATGFRSDCTFCHKFDAQGVFATFPGHTQCAACHSKPGVKPQLTAALDSETCAGCHTPQEIENPGFTKNRRMITQTAVSGKYVDIKFVHQSHFAVRQKFNLDCTTCHYAIPNSTSLANLTLPKMEDCVSCHDMTQRLASQFQMSNCSLCHANTVEGLFTPASHTRNVKPASHTENFRIHHEQAAEAEGAKCFVCHLNVAPSVSANNQCMACHTVMKPASHTARWKEDIHGKYAAIDRTTCATCHRADYCVDCHNELPRSHVPLPQFTGGGHATLALLDTRACLTCHTFQNTCSLCHTGGLTPQATPQVKKPQ
jgi:Cytochrome c7 and related cytochrome c